MICRGLRRQRDHKANTSVRVFGANCSVVQFQNFLCDGQTKTGSGCVGGAASVHTEKRVKQTRQLILRDRITLILKIDRDFINRHLCGDCNAAVRLAICDGVFQEIMESPRQLFRVSIDSDIIVHIKQQPLVIRVKLRIKVASDGTEKARFVLENGRSFECAYLTDTQLMTSITALGALDSEICAFRLLTLEPEDSLMIEGGKVSCFFKFVFSALSGLLFYIDTAPCRGVLKNAEIFKNFFG